MLILYLTLVARKPVFGIGSASKSNKKLEISDIRTHGINHSEVNILRFVF